MFMVTGVMTLKSEKRNSARNFYRIRCKRSFFAVNQKLMDGVDFDVDLEVKFLCIASALLGAIYGILVLAV